MSGLREVRALGWAALIGLVVGGGISCFNPPSADVLFSCAEQGECPDGYSCEEDGCCHRDGSDVDENLGSCALGGGGTETGGDETGGTGTETG